MINMTKICSLMLISILILSSFAAVFSVASASELVEDSWNTKKPMSQARYGLSAVTVDGKIYAIGGQTDEYGSYVGTNELYDPKKDTWTTLKSMPTPRSYFGIVACQGKIYCIGGSGDNTENSLSVNEVYDVATDKWSTKTSLPVSGSHGSPVQAHVVDEKIFVIVSRLLYMYNPVTDSWTQKASLPKTVASDPYVYSAVVDDQIIVIITDEHLEVLIYDPNTDVWSKGKTTGYDSGFAIAVAVATSGRFAPQKIYVLSSGPSFFLYPTGDVFVYDPLSGMWEQRVKDPTPRARFGVAVLDDVLYVIGGVALLGTKGDREALAVNEQYVPIGYHGTGFSDSDSPMDNRILAGALIGVAVAIAVAVLLLSFFKNKGKRRNKTNNL
jgi:N-acetylneuraminic acid mutarotase